MAQSKKATQVMGDPSCGLPKWKNAWCDKLTNRNYGCKMEWDEMDETADPPVYPVGTSLTVFILRLMSLSTVRGKKWPEPWSA